jgi:hypothetical protein
MQLYLAGSVGTSGPVEVAEEDITPDLPANQVQAAFVSALTNLATSAGLSMTSRPTPTTYRSFEAEAATFSSSDHAYRGISLMTDHNARLYILFGSTLTFEALEQSLKLSG